jgi:antitoxin (DNA-binding transcriptional repressor) of toxin-antitoxin stability system
MGTPIDTKQLRAQLARVIACVREGSRFTVLHRGRPAFEIVPICEPAAPSSPLENDTIYRAPALGRSTDKLRTEDHDGLIYGRS